MWWKTKKTVLLKIKNRSNPYKIKYYIQKHAWQTPVILVSFYRARVGNSRRGEEASFLFSPQLVRARYRNFSIFTLQKPAPAKEASILQKQITITNCWRKLPYALLSGYRRLLSTRRQIIHQSLRVTCKTHRSRMRQSELITVALRLSLEIVMKLRKIYEDLVNPATYNQ